MPIVKVGAGSGVIGSDFVTVAPAYGITIKMTERLSIDFENVVGVSLKNGGGAVFTVDPGIVYDLGVVAVGGRVAYNVGQSDNIGLIPLVHRGFAVGDRLSLFVEADMPVFFAPGGPSFSPTTHLGVSF
jgi:hypothetical protein